MGMFDDVLAFIDAKKRTAKRNVSDLVSNPRDYMQKTFDNTATTVKEYVADPMNFLGGGLGKIAYHGSPHKFDKFDMSKIGTGEGAQAYGHGMYLAESPGVAVSYRDTLSDPVWEYKGTNTNFATDSWEGVGRNRAINEVFDEMWRNQDLAPSEAIQKILAELRTYTKKNPNLPNPHVLRHELKKLDPSKFIQRGDGQLYKTDIPDEAVARFLDWDKTWASQPEAVKNAFGKFMRDPNSPVSKDMAHYRLTPDDVMSGASGSSLYGMAMGGNPKLDAEASQYLLSQGIPGIRYLDGGSRSAGQGSSNFVVFDPEMIRILERNGEKTGLKPWSPNEWDGLQYRDPFPDTVR